MSDTARRVPRHAEEPKTPLGLGVPATTGTALEIRDFGDEAGAGAEGLTGAEQLTPFLRMIQGLSPEINPAKAEHVAGAQMGMILNTATKEVWPGSEGLDVILCAREYGYGFWIPRDLGSGFRGMYPADDGLVRETLGRMTTKYGSSARFKMPRYREGRWSDEPPRTRDTDEAIEIVETGQFYALYGPHGDLNDGTASRAILSFTSTAIPVYQGVITRWTSWKWRQPDGRMVPAQLWSYPWHLTTRAQSAGPGKDFFNWNLQLALPAGGLTYRDAILAPDDPLFALGREFYRSYREGAVKADYEAPAAREPGSDDGGVPF